jgi:hypothetical protein
MEAIQATQATPTKRTADEADVCEKKAKLDLAGVLQKHLRERVKNEMDKLGQKRIDMCAFASWEDLFSKEAFSGVVPLAALESALADLLGDYPDAATNKGGNVALTLREVQIFCLQPLKDFVCLPVATHTVTLQEGFGCTLQEGKIAAFSCDGAKRSLVCQLAGVGVELVNVKDTVTELRGPMTFQVKTKRGRQWEKTTGKTALQVRAQVYSALEDVKLRTLQEVKLCALQLQVKDNRRHIQDGVHAVECLMTTFNATAEQRKVFQDLMAAGSQVDTANPQG